MRRSHLIDSMSTSTSVLHSVAGLIDTQTDISAWEQSAVPSQPEHLHISYLHCTLNTTRRLEGIETGFGFPKFLGNILFSTEPRQSRARSSTSSTLPAGSGYPSQRHALLLASIPRRRLHPAINLLFVSAPNVSCTRMIQTCIRNAGIQN